MKVGTDAVLLGSWVDVGFYPNTILDIGSGTGIIALMLAQRSDAPTIDAIEIDGEAYEQSVENFEQSDWENRLFCYHTSLDDFTKEMIVDKEQYDLIVSNPPFYTDNFKSDNSARNTARFTTSLSFKKLIYGVSKLLLENGVFSVIIPKKEQENFVALAQKEQLFLHRFCDVKGTSTTEVKRCLLSFSFQKKIITKEELVIEITRHQYTKKYINLTKEFYLKM